MNLIITTPEELARLIQEAVRKDSAASFSKSAYADNKPMTLEEACEFLQMPKNTLYKYTHERSIPFRKIGRALRFNQKDLTEWLERNRKLTKSEIQDQAMHELSNRRR